MQKELSFRKLDVGFKNIKYQSNVGTWYFTFADKLIVKTGGFWRLLKDSKIIFVSPDHGHLFGFPKPIDLTVEIKNLLATESLKEIVIAKDTGDLTLTFTNQFKIQVYISSSGYESYNFSIDKKRYTGIGSGEVAITEVH